MTTLGYPSRIEIATLKQNTPIAKAAADADKSAISSMSRLFITALYSGLVA